MCDYGGKCFIYKKGNKISALGRSLANASSLTQASAIRRVLLRDTDYKEASSRFSSS